MKKIILIALLLAGFTSKAQYFQHEYGINQSQCWSGINTKIHPPGHVMVGDYYSSGQHGTIVTYTDEFGVPYFNNVYDQNYGDPKIVETATGFGIICTNGNIAYFPLSTTGVAGQMIEYPVIGAVGTIFANAVATSASGNEIYITGGAYDNIGDIFMFIIKIDLNGNLIWSNIYDITGSGFSGSFDVSKDIIESPYSPLGFTEVVVVGGIDENHGLPNPKLTGFLIRVNANTGALASSSPIFYGTSNQDSHLSSIEVANSTSSGGNGFILGGSDNSDFWVMKVDPTGSVLWSNIYDYGFNPSYTGGCSSVIERLNTQGNYEYYAAGSVNDPNAVNINDVVVQKIDDVGNPFPQGEFTYFGLYNVTEIDQYNGTTYDGISVFCNKRYSPISNQMYLVKAYFNGHSGCNEVFSDANQLQGSNFYGQGGVTIFGSFSSNPLGTPRYFSATDNQICYNNTLVDGDNARIAPAEPKGDKESKVSPNPINQGVQYANVEVDIDQPTTAQVSVYDMLGRTYYTQTFTLVKGKNSLVLDISNINMAQGMYTVKIQGENISQNIMWLVK